MNENDLDGIRSRANTLLSGDKPDALFISALNELKVFNNDGKDVVKRDSVDFVELNLGAIFVQIRIEELSGSRKEIDAEYEMYMSKHLEAYYCDILSQTVSNNEMRKALDDVIDKYCKNFKLKIGYSKLSFNSRITSSRLVESLVRVTMAMCNTNKEDSTSFDDNVKSLDELRQQFVDDGLGVRVDSYSFSIYKQQLFHYSVKIFDSDCRRGMSLNAGNMTLIDKVRTVIYDAFQLNTRYLGKDISDILGIDSANVELSGYANVINLNDVKEFKVHLKDLAVFTIKWLSGENFIGHNQSSANEQDLFTYSEAINRTRIVNKLNGVDSAIMIANTKLPNVKFTKLYVSDLATDITLTMKELSGVRSHIVELIVYDMLKEYHKKNQIDVIVNVHGPIAIEAQNDMLMKFAKILVSYAAE